MTEIIPNGTGAEVREDINDEFTKLEAEVGGLQADTFQICSTGGGSNPIAYIEKKNSTIEYPQEFAKFQVGSKVYIYGGKNANWNQYTTNISSYDMATDAFAGGSYGQVPSGFPVFASGFIETPDAFFVMGGFTAPSNSSIISGVFKANKADFNPSTSFSKIGDLPTAVARPAVAYDKTSGYIYSVGGYMSSGDSSAVYRSLVTDMVNWTKVADLPEAIFGANAIIANGKLFVYGGVHVDSSTEGAKIFIADLTQATITFTVSDKTIPAQRGFARLIQVNDILMLVGGQGADMYASGNKAFAAASIKDPETWYSYGGLVRNFAVCGTAYFDGNLYLMGGGSEFCDSDITAIYKYSFDETYDPIPTSPYPVSPIDGQPIFNSSTKKIEVYYKGIWY